MASAPSLVGPPAIRRNLLSVTLAAATSGNPFIDAMVTNFNRVGTISPSQIPQRGLTENNSPTYLSSGNPCLDMFFHVVPDTPKESLIERIEKAWANDALTTLKLICNLRGVRGTGKADRKGYYTAALWLHGHHPKTLACNIGPLGESGYLKDLPEILFRLLEGKKIASLPRDSKKTVAAEEAMKRYFLDPDYRFLFERVSDYFAEVLKSDMQKLGSGEGNKVSLAAKWCPSLDHSYDRATLLCESIARKVFPKESYPEYQAMEDTHYAYRVRARLRKEVLVPLRKALELPEVYIGANKWGSIPYNHVASVAMKLYKEKFLKYDKERFEEYLEKVKEGKATISAGALLPHEIISSLDDGDGGEVAELQWKRMVDDVAEKGTMKNCIAVCDVSASMNGVPMEVSVALGILVSELSDEPWKGKLITFSANPTLQLVTGESLREKAAFIRSMQWGTNTDFQKVFDQLLEVAVNNKLSPEQMVKTIFVFSDMEFDEASGKHGYYPYRFYDGYGNYSWNNGHCGDNRASSWDTDYEIIQRKFREKGFGNAIPDIVFWNLRDSNATPVPSNQKGVALVSGYSKNLMTLFLNNCKALDPESIMKAAISGPLYDKLVIID